MLGRELLVLAVGLGCGVGATYAYFVHGSWARARLMRLEAQRKAESEARQSQESQHLLNLLYNIAETQARKEGFVHRGTTCKLCQASPLRGIRFKCANCVDYDVCESCEAVDTHNRTHTFIQIKIPIPPLANPRTVLLTPFYPGNPSTASSEQLAWSTLRKLQRETYFDKVELEALFEQYQALSTATQPGGGIDKDTFHRCLGPLGREPNLITDRIFKFFDRDDDNIINFHDLASGLSVLCKGRQETKIMYAFKGYDVSNSGFITRDELRRMFKAYFLLSTELVRDVVKALEEEMMINFNDKSDKPVSAVFTAPIPPGEETTFDKRTSRSSLSSSSLNESMNVSRSLEPSQENVSLLMEAMSQDAIEELVNTAFAHADLDGDDRLSFEEFKVWATSDPTMIAWFDSLGSVF
eukprot:m.29700 g.29700  ORF g.29700 m.29700 type:complete len:411 (-) comp10467_c0_seq1:223-1455(-)